MKESKFEKAFLNPKNRWAFHLLFWLFLYNDEWFALVGITPPLESPLGFLLELGFDMLIVYFNIYFLLPRFLLKKKLLLYALYSFLSLLLLFFMSSLAFDNVDCISCGSELSHFLIFMNINVSILGLAVGIKLFKYYYKNKIQVSELKQDKLKTELSALKAQINPHFLFNALNSIHVLAQKSPKETPQIIMILSDILKYQLYDCQEADTLLSKEVEYVENLLNLEKLKRPRLIGNIALNKDFHDHRIAPLILLPLIENAFKYSKTIAEIHEQIDIEIESRADRLHIKFGNNVGDADFLGASKAVGGIGLSNLKKRLDILYPEKYNFQTQVEGGIFTAELWL